MTKQNTTPKPQEPEVFYMTLELPGWVREKFAKIAEANKRSMKGHGEYMILEAVQKFEQEQTQQAQPLPQAA